MQKDSMHFSTSGHMTHNQAPAQESLNKSYPCSRCTLILKSKVYLFEHLNTVHGFDVDAALRDAGLKGCGTNEASTDNYSSSSEDIFECRNCDFKACNRDVLKEHEKRCQKKSENQDVIENQSSSEHSADQLKEAEGAKEISSVFSVMPTSKSKSAVKSSKDLKTYKRPLQTITKYFTASSESNGKPPMKLADSPVLLESTKGTLLLQESQSDSSPNSSGVFKVTAKPTIDISDFTQRFLLDDHLHVTDPRPPKPKEQLKETVPNNIGKRTCNERSKSPPAKKAKTDREEPKLQEKANSSKEPSHAEFPLEFSEDEEEKLNVVNGEMEKQAVYSCKHCDYSDVSIRCVSTHYQNDHPYIRYKAAYIQDPNDQSATFRCLECPVEFLSGAALKRHYIENHPGAPNIFKIKSHELCLVYKCFVCQFTTNGLTALKEHYKEKHPTHKLDHSLMYCRYSVAGSEEGPSQLNTCEKAPSPERSQGISPACTPSKEVKNPPSPQDPTFKGGDMAFYHCNNCTFSHKSVVVMQVHYQKSHPDEAVTIDKIKQSARATSHATSMPVKSPNSVTIQESTPQKNVSDSSKETRNKTELSKQKIPLSENTPEASETHSESPQTKVKDRSKRIKSRTKHKNEVSTEMDSFSCSSPGKLYYCQLCSYSSINIKSVVGHHNAKHTMHGSTDIEEILHYSSKVRKKKPKSESEASARTEATDASWVELNAYASAENLFYCQKCNYANTSVTGVLNHQNKLHQSIVSNSERVLEYTALIRDEIEKSSSQAKESPLSTHLPLPLLNGEKEDVFFCHFCNYRQNSVNNVLKHYLKKHRGFLVSGDQIRLYTSMVLKQIQTSQPKTTTNEEANHASLRNAGHEDKKTKKLGKVSASPSMRASQTERTLQCHRCPYRTQYVYLLKRHIWRVHKAYRSVTDVLSVCFKQGTLQSGYHCDLCVFSHKKAATVYEHYREQHPGRKLSLEYVTTRLYVGPEKCSPTKKKPQKKHSDCVRGGDGTDGSLSSQRFGQNETKMYACRACSFKGNSMSSITHHYRVVHPWSVKEDGSVLDVINSKRLSANRQVEDHNDMPVSFDTHLAPLDSSPGSCHDTTEFSSLVKCPFCPAKFGTQRGLNTHCGMKHQESLTENLEGEQEEQEQKQTRMHVFKCPHCTYVNTSYHGVLTHCQMRHPDLTSRADSLYVDEAPLKNWEDCLKRKGPDLRLSGYMCKTCPQIYATLEKLNKHCERCLSKTVESAPKAAPKPSGGSKKIQFKIHSNQSSLSKASFLRKKIYAVVKCQYCAYSCSTKLGLDRHVLVRHKNASVSKVHDEIYRCALCSNSYFRKKRLGNHYTEKHGRESYLKYYVPLYKQLQKKSESSVRDRLLTQAGETSEACKSSMTAEENKVLVYKCPSCPYVNASYHGTLTHCQMKHPDIVARADELLTDEVLVTNLVGCTMGKGLNQRGYVCRKCPQIHVSLKKLKIHCERDHDQAQEAASEHSVESETEKEPDYGFQGSVLEAVSSKNKSSAMSTTETGLSDQRETPETCQSSTPSGQKEFVYKCHICSYIGSCRKYLHCHYKNTHKFDALTTCKMLQRYNKYKRSKISSLAEAESEESACLKCKMCPNLEFDSSQLLITHYRTFHSSDCISDFIVLSQGSKKTTGLYKCSLCNKQINGIRKLCLHLDRHRERQKTMAEAAKRAASLAITTTPEAKSTELSMLNEVPMLDTVEDLAQWNVTPVQTFVFPQSPLSSPSKNSDLERPELESREAKNTCKQCGRSFMSLKGLRSHERSHAALAAIKNLDHLSTSAVKHNINKYMVYKVGTLRPFLCSFCSYRTTVMGLWRSHFLKKHQTVFLDAAATARQDEESSRRFDEEPHNSSEELSHWPEFEGDPEITEKSLYLEPQDVQRQLNHYNLVAQAGASSKANMQRTKLPESSLLHCEVCTFSTGHLSSMRRHYLNRHGKKIFRCKDCSFFTGLRKTLEMHMETDHSTFQSQSTHQKDLCCPFCLYQTKNKNNMIDHIVLHREERVVPIEVRRPKLSRYLQGIVFRCHKCTFTSGSAENLRSHMMRHDDVKPYKCRLCYFDCTQLSDLEAHLSDKHQVVRNHELVGQINLDQLEATVGRMPEEEEERLSNLEYHNNDSEDVKTEKFVPDCDEVPHETHAKNPAENNMKENLTPRTKETCERQGNDDNNEESPAKSCAKDGQYDNTKPNTTEKQERDSQEQAADAFLPDPARRQGMENTAEQNAGGGKNTDYSCPEKERRTNEDQAQPRLRGTEDSSASLTQQKEEAAEGSSTTMVEKAQALKLNIKALKHRMLNIEGRVERNMLRNVLLLDGSICEIKKKAGQDTTVKTEQNIEPEVADNVLNEILDEEGSRTLAHIQSNQVNVEAISASSKTNHSQANNFRAQEHFTVERHLLTLPPNCGQLKISHNEILGVSFTNFKEEQVQSQKNSEELRDPYGEMPVLENEYIKEEMDPLDCCKEEDQNDHHEQEQNKKEEMVTDEDDNRFTNWKRQEGEGIKEDENPHVSKGALKVTDGAAEVLCPAATEEKLFTCDLCGRNLMNSSELERHVMRHGI